LGATPNAVAYLTPDTLPTGTRCGVLIYPDSDEFAANLRGALELLTFPESFVQYGTLTPEQTAEGYVPMFDGFCFNQGVCRMIGEIITYAGPTSPDPKWLPCDGASLLRVGYPDLFAVVGTIYGAADSSHFNVPDLRGRVEVGSGTGPGLSPRAAGDVFGEETHILSIGELASHVHGTGNSVLIATATPPPLDVLGPNPFPAITGSTGNDDPHNNVQPSLAITFLIVALQ